MRLPGTACTTLVSMLAGCSLLYNPNNLPEAKLDAGPVLEAPPSDAPPDMPTDTNVDMPSFMDIGPSALLEGQGTGGSRPAILAIVGGNFGPDATVTIEPTAGPDPTILIEVDNASIVRSPSGTALAVPVTLPVDPAHGSPDAADVPLTITVTQMGTSQPIKLVIPDKVTLRNLPELTAPITAMGSPPILYSQVKVTAPIAFAASRTANPAVIRAVGSIELADVHADAGGNEPGPGGGFGGSATGNGGGMGGGKAAILLAIGSTASGGGYGEAGGRGTGLAAVAGGAASGDELITRYSNNSSSGGGGGGALSSVGGGGGGTLEITAGGTLKVGKVSANGAGGGGGGSGGAIVLRSGGLATLDGDITASGGAGGGGAGDGGRGRLRYDLPAQMGTPLMTAVKRAGVAFDTGGNPLITTDAHQRLRVIGESASTTWTVWVLNAVGDTTSMSPLTFGSASASISPTLTFGYNRVCVSPPMGNPTLLVESTNCIDIAYVP